MSMADVGALLDLRILFALVLGLTLLTFLLAPIPVSPIVLFPNSPTQILNSKPGTTYQQVNFEEAVRDRCKSLFNTYISPWWLFNGHLQTLFCILGDFTMYDKINYKRQLLRLVDGGTLGLDFAPIDESHLKDDTPVVVVQHGLTGGSYEPYVRAILHPLCTPVLAGGLGYRAVVVNFRGCAGVPVTTSKLFSAGETYDLRQALMYISRLYPDAPLLGLGFSLGANVLTRYLAEEGHRSRLNSACIMACPWDLLFNDEALQSSWLKREIYSRGMGSNLLALVRRHRDALLHEPGPWLADAVTEVMKIRSPTMREFHQTFGRFDGVAPEFPFSSAKAYFKGMSSATVIGNVEVPLLSINALDDPIVHHVPLHGGGNSRAVMVLTPGGGHLGWFQSHSRRWTTKPVLEWLQLVADNLAGGHREPRATFVDSEDWIREHGSENLGCVAIEGGGIIDGNSNSEEIGALQGL